MHPVAQAAYALAWLSFGAGHSLLAAGRVKACLAPRLGPFYRLCYNLVAALHLLAVGWLGAWLLGDEPPFALPPAARLGLLAVHLAGWLGLVWTMRFYDAGRLLGLSQVRRPDAPEDEPLRLDGPHRWVRHPLYAFAFLVLWGAALAPLGLATALWGSFYLVVGSRFEERRLLALYGQSYADYRRRVPAFLPWKGPCAPDGA